MLKPTDKQFLIEVPEVGKFVFRYPSMKDELDIDATTAKLLSENPSPSVGAKNIAIMAATIEVMATSTPDQFKLDNIYSYEEIESVYAEYIKQVFQFRDKTEKRPSD